MNELMEVDLGGMVNIEESKKEITVQILDLETKLKALPQLDISVTHHFSKDVYAREMFMPKGSLLVGKIHKHKNLNILSSGDVAVLSVDGVMRVKAPYTFVASAGAKRVIYAHEDTVWTVIHGSSETDLEKLEEEFIAKTYDEVSIISEEDFNALKEAKCLG